MARLIRTEYIATLEKILAHRTAEAVDNTRIEAMIETVRVAAAEDLLATSAAFPPVLKIQEGYASTNVNYSRSPQVKEVETAWNKIQNDLYYATRGSYGMARSVNSFKNIQEDCRVMLAWATEDIKTTTVLLRREHVSTIDAGLRFINGTF